MTSISALSALSFTSKDEQSLIRKAEENTPTASMAAVFTQMVASAQDEKAVEQTLEAKHDSGRPAKKDVVQEFLDYMAKSPAERLRDQILAEKGLTEEDVEAMSPEKRAALEEEIAQRIQDSLTESAAGEIEEQIEARIESIIAGNGSLFSKPEASDTEDPSLIL